jgi:hypothetical protein
LETQIAKGYSQGITNLARIGDGLVDNSLARNRYLARVKMMPTIMEGTGKNQGNFIALMIVPWHTGAGIDAQ